MLEVSQTDKDGFTITIKAPDQATEKTGGVLGRRGRIYLTSPSGETVEGGYWMDFPEEGWTFEGVDLYADYTRNGRSRKTVYYGIPQEQRMMMEAVEQATTYQLRETFEFHKLHPEEPEDRRLARVLQAKLMDSAAIAVGLTARQRFVLGTLV